MSGAVLGPFAFVVFWLVLVLPLALRFGKAREPSTYGEERPVSPVDASSLARLERRVAILEQDLMRLRNPHTDTDSHAGQSAKLNAAT